MFRTDFIISRFHHLVPLMNDIENGNGVIARLTGLTQYLKLQDVLG
jgi:hypothetical protein